MFNSMQELEEYFKNRKQFGIKPGLERVEVLLEKLGNPEKTLPIVHVAGTNGKGSTVQFIADALMAHGSCVGIFTSPSFTGITGHILKNRVPIQSDMLLTYMNEMLPYISELDDQNNHPTEFEIITVLALHYFKNNVDIAIIEAGMGGRFDTTNCVIPAISVITTIAKDHMQYLGATEEEISYHKAGIMKESRPVIIGKVSTVAKKVLMEEAMKNNCQVYRLGEHFTVKNKGGNFVWSELGEIRHIFSLRLLGDHQRDNAALALMALHILEREQHEKLNWDIVIKTMKQTELPGRFELITKSPPIILDSAHNLAGMEAFIKTAKQYYEIAGTNVLFASFRDKQVIEMIDCLVQEEMQVVLTTFDHDRAATISELKETVSNYEKVLFYEKWEKALEGFITKGHENRPLFITGSLHFITYVRQYLLKRKNEYY